MTDQPQARDLFDDEAAERVKKFIDRYSTMSIIRATATVFEIPLVEILSNSRTRRAAIPRMVAMYLARKLTLRSTPQIGRAFCRDHTTVLSAERKIAQKMEKSPSLVKKIETIICYLAAENRMKIWAGRCITWEDDHVPGA